MISIHQANTSPLEKERKLVGQHPAATCVCAAQVDSIRYTRHDISQPFLSYRGARLFSFSFSLQSIWKRDDNASTIIITRPLVVFVCDIADAFFSYYYYYSFLPPYNG
jgi:hypothetical protein